jgi:elongation factor G
MEPPTQIVFVEIEPHTTSDQEKLAHGLQKLKSEDPTFRFHTDPQTGKTILRGTAELHLEIIVDRLRREFHVEPAVGRPQVIYRGTLARAAEGEGRFVRTIAGRSQYAHAKIRIFPGVAGSGYSFESQVAEMFPERFIRAVDEGIREALSGGAVAGYTLDDVRVELYDGSFHERDSSETAFRVAGALAFENAAIRARAAVREPVMEVEVAVPEQYMAGVIGDLNSRRGCIVAMESRGATQIIKGSVPLAELLGYPSDLRERTQGSGQCSMRFDRYRLLPEGPPDEDEDRIAPVMAPRKPAPKGQDPGVAIPEPDQD